MANVILLQVNILDSLSMPEIFELVRGRRGKSLCLRVVHDAAVVERLKKLVNVVRLVTSLELDWLVLPC